MSTEGNRRVPVHTGCLGQPQLQLVDFLAKKQLTIRVDEDTIEYFRELAEENGIPYQSLINLYLRECAAKKRKLHMKWAS